MLRPVRPVRITPPAVIPVSLAEAKEHMRVLHGDEDALILRMIAASVGHLDGYGGVFGRCMINQSWRNDFCGWPVGRCLRLPFPDVSSVTVAYYDEGDLLQTVDPGEFDLVEDSISNLVLFRSSFSRPAVNADRPGPVRVTMVTGYGDTAADVPEEIREAILLYVAHLYENREAVVLGVSVTKLLKGFDALISGRRIRSI